MSAPSPHHPQPQQQQQPESEPDAERGTSYYNSATICAPHTHVWVVTGPDQGIDERPERTCRVCGLVVS